MFELIVIFRNRWIRETFHRLDRAMIYLFIAGSYTPWLALKTYMPHGGLSVWLEWAIWPISAIGILYQQLFHERNKLLSTVLYVIIAVFPALVVFEMVISIFVTICINKNTNINLSYISTIYILKAYFTILDGFVRTR